MAAPGRFITFEGIDGSGKSTQMSMLAEQAHGRRIATERPVGECVDLDDGEAHRILPKVAS